MLEWRKECTNKKKQMIVISIGSNRKDWIILINVLVVIILIINSLTMVIGYQSIKSASTIDSPMFRIRTERATNQYQNRFTSKYLGMEHDNILQLSSRNNRTDLLKKAGVFLKNMDEKTFNLFTHLYLYQLQQKGKITDANREKIEEALRQFRDSPVSLDTYDNNDIMEMTWRDTPTLCWFPGCQLYFLFLLIYLSVTFFLISVLGGETSCGTCISHCTSAIDMNKVNYLLIKTQYIG